MQTRATSTLSVVFASLALAASTAGCGGSSGACGVQPCGGDPVGNWNASGACADSAELNMAFLEGLMGFCTTASLSGYSIRPSGTFNLAADLTYSLNMTLNMTVGVNIPGSCLMGQTCAALNTALQAQMTAGQSVSCAGSGSCNCTFNIISTDAETGTYTTAGTEMALTSAAGSTSGGPYCVQGSTLHLLTVDTSMPMATIQSDIVFSR